uniref:Uncharacterized protein n=1 Tax=Rhizophora mucronata TaxID=61149 RepID=A0A2P2PTU6_RHIMU
MVGIEYTTKIAYQGWLIRFHTMGYNSK